MRKVMLCLLIVITSQLKAQVSISLQLPQVGMVLKSQLWSMNVFNNATTSTWVHFELTLSDANSGTGAMTATTGVINILPGSQLLQNLNLGNVLYVAIDPLYQPFVVGEFMPVGQFLACIAVVEHRGDVIQRIAEECQYIEVEPIGPPMLVFPFNETAIETPLPVFNWLPPSPFTLFTNLSYDLQLVKVLPGQTDADAVEMNLPVLNSTGLSMPMFPYDASQPPLEQDQRYAWRVVAKNGQSVVTTTEVWWFTYKTFGTRDSTINSSYPFVRLRKDDQPTYAVAVNDLKFDYNNETSDTTWSVRLTDITSATSQVIDLHLDSIPLRRGRNFITIPLKDNQSFTEKHLYSLEILNSRNEVWQLRFEYIRKEEETQP